MPGFDRQDIRSHPLSEEQIDVLQKLAGSYEALFSKRARLYHEWKLRERTLEEKDYRKYLLADYTFLKRPVVVCGNQIFIGQEKKNLDALKACLLNISGT